MAASLTSEHTPLGCDLGGLDPGQPQLLTATAGGHRNRSRIRNICD
jgi:hypothetical protein